MSVHHDTIFVTSAIVICGSGCDKVSFATTLPSGEFPYTGVADVCLSVAAGKGEEYVRKHFPDIKCEVVNRSVKEMKFGVENRKGE